MAKVSRKNDYIYSAIEQVAEKGIENLRTKNLMLNGKKCEANLYNYFGSKNELLIASYKLIDEAVLGRLRTMIIECECEDAEELIYSMWSVFFDYFCQNQDEALFMIRFRFSSYFTDEIKKERYLFSADFNYIFRELSRRCQPFNNINMADFVNFLYEAALYKVEDISNKKTIVDEELKTKTWNVIKGGINGILVC